MGFLDAVTNFFAPVTQPIVSISSQVASTIYRPLGVTPQIVNQPQVQQFGNQLVTAGILASAAVVAAPLAAAAVPAIGGTAALGTIGAGILTHAQDITNVLSDAGSSIDQGISDTTDDLLPIDSDSSDADFA